VETPPNLPKWTIVSANAHFDYKRLAAVGVELSVGSVGGFYDKDLVSFPGRGVKS
jgi:hypothetical protein